MSRSTDVVVVGAGHNGLAMSARLGELGIDHAVLERGRVANSWRTQRWDSLRLLTPNWQSVLPGYRYSGPDPDGFMSMPEVIAFVEGYAEQLAAPVHTETTVERVRRAGEGFAVLTDQGEWRCRAVVLAAGACTVPNVPDCASALPPGIASVSPLDYRSPDDLPDGGVLVVGAAATGVQLAEEFRRSGRPVTLSVGEHVRMPRTYRGRDIQYWMDVTGRLDERHDEVDEILRSRGVASPQLIGTPERRSIDLNSLTAMGVEIRGRLGTIRDGVAMFSGGLRNHCKLADQKLGRLLDDVDDWITDQELDADVEPAERPDPTSIPADVPLTLDLTRGDVSAVVWATGFKADLSWLDVEVFDDRGRLRHDGGVVDEPGLYFLGANFLRRRRSSFISGAEADVTELAEHVVGYLGTSGST